MTRVDVFRCSLGVTRAVKVVGLVVVVVVVLDEVFGGVRDHVVNLFVLLVVNHASRIVNVKALAG